MLVHLVSVEKTGEHPNPFVVMADFGLTPLSVSVGVFTLLFIVRLGSVIFIHLFIYFIHSVGERKLFDTVMLTKGYTQRKHFKQVDEPVLHVPVCADPDLLVTVPHDGFCFPTD